MWNLASDLKDHWNSIRVVFRKEDQYSVSIQFAVLMLHRKGATNSHNFLEL